MKTPIGYHPVVRYAGVLVLAVLSAGLIGVTASVNIHSIAWLVAVYVTVLLTLQAIRHAKTSPLHQAYAVYQGTLALYLLNVWMLHVSVPGRDPEAVKTRVDTLAQMIRVGSIYMSVSLYHLMLRFSDARRGLLRAIEWAGWAIMTLFFMSNLCGTFVDGWRWTGTTWVPLPQGHYKAFFYTTTVFVSLGLFVPILRLPGISSHRRRIQIMYYLLGAFPLWVSCWAHFLMSLGLNIYPAGGILFIFHASIIAYAVLRHRVFDITIVIRRGLAYACVSVVMGMIFGVASYGGGLMLGGLKETPAQLPTILFILISGFVLVPLYSWMQGWVDKLFFRRAKDRQKSLGQFSTKVSSTLDLYRVCEAMYELIYESLRPTECKVYLATDSGQMVLYGAGKDGFLPDRWPEGPSVPPEIERMLKERAEPCLFALPPESAAGAEKVLSMAGGEQGLVVPIRHQGKELGIIVLGPRISDEEYGDDDIEWMELIAAQASVALSNAKTFASVKYLTGLTEKIVEELAAGLVLMDAKGNLLRWNTSAQRILAIPPSGTIPATLDSLWDRQPILASAIKRNIQLGEDVSNLELRLEGKKPLWVLLGVGILKGAREEKEYLITLHDISDYKSMEFLAQTNAALAQLGQLIASINHEVKNMIQPMRYQVEGLLRGKILNEPAAKSLEIVLNRVDALEELLNSLKDLSRPIHLIRRQITLWKLVDSVLLDIAELPQAKQIKFTAEVAKNATCLGDGHWLKRVIYNLIRNASEATAKSQDPRVEISGSVQGGKIEISIRDNGCGIKEEHLPRLFEPFFSTKAEAGTGLGLSISRRIIELHGGRIQVMSEAEKGTTFTLELPLAQEITSQETSSSS